MKTFEKWAEVDLKKRVKAAGGKVIKLGGNQENGLPDDLVIMPGMPALHFYVELKSLKKVPSKLQQVKIGELAKIGCNVGWGNTPYLLETFYCFIGLQNWQISENIKNKYAV